MMSLEINNGIATLVILLSWAHGPGPGPMGPGPISPGKSSVVSVYYKNNTAGTK
jgi:hypothetical protein